uniref:Uncharacterized protein n=1 Tax=Ditylenchus dipsaci TaxID=166011 RepID=A0A915E4M0_9BILA
MTLECVFGLPSEKNAAASVYYQHVKFCCCSIYVYMMYFVTTEALMHFAEFCWLHIHGFPPVIYLAFNSTIQKDAKRMIKKVFCKISEREFKSTVTTVKPQINRTQGIKKATLM